MTKAFTKDEGEGSEAVVPARSRSVTGEKRAIIPEGFRGLQAELAALQSADLARDGSLQSSLQKAERARRAQTLHTILDEVTVVAPEPQATVAFGAFVTLEDQDGVRVSYRLVGPDEADAKAAAISVASPLARALLGKAKGEQVTVDRPRGSTEYVIRDVSYR